MRVFLSSTFLDLVEEREAVHRRVFRLNPVSGQFHGFADSDSSAVALDP